MNTSNTPYAGVTPPKKWLKTQIVRFTLYYLGKAIEFAYKHEPEAKKEMDTLPDTFSFCVGVINGPTLFIQKSGDTVTYLGELDNYHVDLELRFKTIELGFMAMLFRLSTPEAVYHNRQFVKGDLNLMMRMLRVMNIAQSLIFPNILARYYLKKLPKFSVRRVINRVKYNVDAIIGLSL